MNKRLPNLTGENSQPVGSQSGVKNRWNNQPSFLTQTIFKTSLILGFILSSLSVFAQNTQVTGKVTDSKDGSPVFGASVLATGGGAKQGTQTAADGSFSLSVPAGTTKLVISSIGYDKQEVALGSKSTFSISLVSNSQDLNQVVVIGYGTVKKKDLTGAVATVSPKDFNEGVISSPAQLLQNKVAGLEITTSSGTPGAANAIKIRGNTSIRSSTNPLYVVDGIPLDGGDAKPGADNGFGGATSNDPLTYINPNDIAQFDVLKDASSTAIYGSRGANGVIVITTKRGSIGAPKIDLNANFTSNAGLMKDYSILSASQFRSAITKYKLSPKLDGGKTVNAIHDLENKNIAQNYNIAFTGGNEYGRYRASFYGGRDQGYIQKSYLDKFIGTVSGEYKFIDKRLTLNFNLISANTNESSVPTSNNAGSVGNIISSALSWNPTTTYHTDSMNTYTVVGNGSGNPFALNAAYNDKTNINTFLGSISAAYQILPSLEYKFTFGGNRSAGTRDINIEGWLPGVPNISGVGRATIAHALLSTQDITHTLTYRTKLSDQINFTALAGYDYYYSNFSIDAETVSGFNTNLDQLKLITIPYTSIFQNAKTVNPLFTGVAPKTEIQSYFGRVDFNVSDKYYLTGTFRADGSNKFGANNKYAYFPSGAVKWVLKNENFLKDSKFFSELALRGSYGITGSQEFPSGSAQEQYYLSSYNNISQVNVANPNLKWEQTRESDIGLHFGLAGGKIFGDIDYYHKNTTQILFQTNAIQPAPATQYFVNLNANLINSGVEFFLGANIIEHTDLSWTLTGNVAYNHGILKNFVDPNTGLPLSILTGTIDGQGVSGTYGQIVTNNQPVDAYYLKHFGGFDAKGNQIIGANPQFAGDPNPHTIAGLSSVLRYKKLTFNANFGGAFGIKIYNNTATSVTNISGIVGGRNIDLNAYNSAEGTGSGVAASDRFLENGNFVKLRNASLSYNFGNTGKYVKNFRVFVTGSNLLVITKFSGFDPEVNSDKSANNIPSRSIEYLPYPTPRTISIGLGFTL